MTNRRDFFKLIGLAGLLPLPQLDHLFSALPKTTVDRISINSRHVKWSEYSITPQRHDKIGEMGELVGYVIMGLDFEVHEEFTSKPETRWGDWIKFDIGKQTLSGCVNSAVYKYSPSGRGVAVYKGTVAHIA